MQCPTSVRGGTVAGCHHETVNSQRAAQSAVDKARARAHAALLAAAAVNAAAAEKQKRRKQSTVDRERARLAAARKVVVPTAVPELDPVCVGATDSPAVAAMAPAVAAVGTLGTVATLAVGADADSRRHQTPLEDDRVRALEDKVAALETHLRQTADSLHQKRQAYRADADAWGKKSLSLMNLNDGLKGECAGLKDEIAGLKLRLQILPGEAAVATASGNGIEMRCLQPTPLAALEMAALQTENDTLKDRLQDIADLLDSDPDDYYLAWARRRQF